MLKVNPFLKEPISELQQHSQSVLVGPIQYIVVSAVSWGVAGPSSQMLNVHGYFRSLYVSPGLRVLISSNITTQLLVINVAVREGTV